ncbi:MAG TPA: hypothetical protein VMW62_16115 [Chloroflexota bacterium]|nr:hypothetical protein [Chloroflexota bacterium]
MIQRFRILFQLPGQMLLSWRLFRDPRVPMLPKLMVAGAVLLVLSPLDIFDWLPFVGGAGGLALLAIVLRSFVNAVPEDVRAEHESLLGLRSS